MITSTHACTLCAHLLSVEAGRRYLIPWNWNYGQLLAAAWVLGIEPRSSAKAASALNR